MGKDQSQAQSKLRPVTAFNRNQQTLLPKAAQARQQLGQAPTSQPDVYYGDFDGRDAANSADEEQRTNITNQNLTDSQRRRDHDQQTIMSMPKDNHFRYKKKSATTDKKPLIGNLNINQDLKYTSYGQQQMPGSRLGQQ